MEKYTDNKPKSVNEEIELKDMPLLTVSQTSQLFNLGARTIRGLVASHPKANWFLMNGNRVMIKNDLFKDYIYRQTRI